MLLCKCTTFGDAGLSAYRLSAMFPPSIFKDRCADLRRSMCRPSEIDVSKIDGRCEITCSKYRYYKAPVEKQGSAGLQNEATKPHKNTTRS